MPITGLDHFALLTDDAAATARFYAAVLGLQKGARPDFPVPGAWLYCGGNPVLHVVERPRLAGSSPLDHMAFAGCGLADTIQRLRTSGTPFDLKKLSAPGEATWQLFFHDPNGARVEVDFSGGERPPD